MPLKYAPVIRVCFAVGTLMWCGAQAAEQKPSLIGASRSEVLARFGEPKSQIVVGNRQVLFFAGERVVIRDDRVVEAEEIAVEPTPAPVAEKPAVAAGNGDAAPASASPGGESSATSNVASQSQETSSRPTRAIPEVMIKSVRPPSRVALPAASVPAASAPAAKPEPARQEPVRTAGPQVQTAAPAVAAVTAPAVQPAKEPVSDKPAETATPAPKSAPAAQADKSADPVTTTAAVSQPPAATVTHIASPVAARHPATTPAETETDTADVVSSAFTVQTYIIAAVLIGGGIGYLGWRMRQRRLELAATAVSHEPFAAAAVARGTDSRFTADVLNQLDRNRFEELVAAYYNKTGVVATRGGAGPTGPVQIRISWKGEQRPFACVRCIAHPEGLIDSKQVQELCDAIAAEDIRRGYVVTTGKFGVPARDLAEEKHVTLLPGDLFLEKLNALPEAARAELLAAATAVESPGAGVGA